MCIVLMKMVVWMFILLEKQSDRLPQVMISHNITFHNWVLPFYRVCLDKIAMNKTFCHSAFQCILTGLPSSSIHWSLISDSGKTVSQGQLPKAPILKFYVYQTVFFMFLCLLRSTPTYKHYSHCNTTGDLLTRQINISIGNNSTLSKSVR